MVEKGLDMEVVKTEEARFYNNNERKFNQSQGAIANKFIMVALIVIKQKSLLAVSFLILLFCIIVVIHKNWLSTLLQQKTQIDKPEAAAFQRNAMLKRFHYQTAF